MTLLLTTLSTPLEQLSSQRLGHIGILLACCPLDLLPLKWLMLHYLVPFVQLCRLSLHHLLLLVPRHSSVLIVHHL